MASIKLSPSEREAVLPQIKAYCLSELDRELGGFEAEFLLDFLLERLGPAIYNRALYDAQAMIDSRLEMVKESLYELEQ